MALFRKVKEENIKPLSEKDIQQKLYGFYHQERSVNVVEPPKKTARNLDLKSVEVTPAGILQTELFRSEALTQKSSETLKVGSSFEVDRTSVIEDERDLSIAAPEDFGEVTSAGVRQEPFAPIKKQTSSRRTVRKKKVDKRRSEALEHFSRVLVENTGSALSWTASSFSNLFSFIAERIGSSREEGRRMPAKLILISLAAIGTGLIFYNVWSARFQWNQPAVNAVKSNNSLGEMVTRMIAVSGDTLSKSDPGMTSLRDKEPAVQAPPVKKYFSIQVCVAQSRDGALGVVQRLKAAGLPAFYDHGMSRRGVRLYRVMVGKFDNFLAAKTQLESFKKVKVMEPYQDSFIRNLVPAER